MPDFNPGDGWREVQQDEVPPTGYLYYCAPQVDDTDDDSRYWVREEPVPPLPTEPYTVIRVTWMGGPDTPYVLLDTGEWLDIVLGNRYAAQKFGRITGFEVLARPMPDYDSDDEFAARVRRETAKAVLDRLRALHDASETWPDAIRIADNEFGVES